MFKFKAGDVVVVGDKTFGIPAGTCLMVREVDTGDTRYPYRVFYNGQDFWFKESELTLPSRVPVMFEDELPEVTQHGGWREYVEVGKWTFWRFGDPEYAAAAVAAQRYFEAHPVDPVREALEGMLSVSGADAPATARAILEKFDVTPKAGS